MPVPDTPQASEINKAALNGLVDLYYLYVDMVRSATRADESSDELDRFYLRGGLKEMIEKYYTLTNLDPVVAGSAEEPVTLERMLPRKTIADVIDEAEKQIALIKGDLKYFSDSIQAYDAGVPQEVHDLIQEGRTILANRLKRSRSTAHVATTNLASNIVTYENHSLKIGSTDFPVRPNTLEDHVLEYMFTHCEKEEWVNRDNIVNWVIDTMNDETKTSRSVYDKCNDINTKITQRFTTQEKLFDTSRDGYVRRCF